MKKPTNENTVPPCGLNNQYMTEIEAAFDRLGKAAGTTGIVYSRVFDTLDRVNFTGRDAVESCSKRQFLQVLHELRQSCTNGTALADPSELRAAAERLETGNTVPLAVARVAYDHFNRRVTRQVAKRMLEKPASLGLDQIQPQDVLQLRECFMAAALVDGPVEGNTIRFKLGPRFRVANNGCDCMDLEIDFSDGSGFRPVPAEGELVVSYGTGGAKPIVVRARTGETVLTARTELQVADKVERDAAATATPTPVPITATESYSGVTASGKYYVWPAAGHTTVVKPAIFCEAFRPGGSTGADDIYARLTQSGIAEALGTAGYDIVVLRPDDELTYIQANGYLFKTLLTTLNAGPGRSGQGIAFGIGLGALIARFALYRMRQAGIDPQVSHYVSLDGPHGGLNVSPGVQLLLSGFKVWSQEAVAVYNQLRSPALKQSLAYTCMVDISSWPSTDQSAVAAPAPERAQLLANLGNLSDLTGMTKLAIGNGAINGTGQGFGPGAAVLSCTMRNGKNVEVAWFNSSALPQGDAQLASMVVHCCKGVGKVTGQANGTKALDSCPGASNTYYLDTLAGDLGHGPFNIGGETVNPDVKKLVGSLSFVPSVSAVAYNDGGDPGAAIEAPTQSGFDEFFLPDANGAYGTLSQPAMTWLRNVMIGPEEEHVVSWRDRTSWASRIDGLVIPPDVAYRYTSTWVEVTCVSGGQIKLSLSMNGRTLCSLDQAMAANTTWSSAHYCVPFANAILLVTGSIFDGSPVEMTVRLKAKRYGTGRTIPKQAFVAYANPTSMFEFLDHTFIDCPDNGTTFQCFGGLGSHDKPVARGNGYLGLAEKYRNNCSWFTDNAYLGIYILGGGVCHQAANCFLLSTGQMLASSVQGYWLSVALFGFYGRRSTAWFNDVYLPKYGEFLREHGATIPRPESPLLQNALMRRYATWKAGEAPSTNDMVIEDTRMLMQTMPDVSDIDPDVVRRIQAPMLDTADQIYREYEAKATVRNDGVRDIAPDQLRQMAGKLNDASITFQGQLEQQLGSDKFTRLTGLPPGRRTGIVDPTLIK